MILNRKFYLKFSPIKSFWISRQMKKFNGEGIFKAFKLHKTEWPDRLYFYSQRLKRVPKFTGDQEALSRWQESKLCETICPTQAIKVTVDAFTIDDCGCICCGLCVELAPPGLLFVPSELPKYRS